MRPPRDTLPFVAVYFGAPRGPPLAKCSLQLSTDDLQVTTCKLCGHGAETAVGPLKPAGEKSQQQQQQREDALKGSAFNKQKRRQTQQRLQQGHLGDKQQSAYPGPLGEMPSSVVPGLPTPEKAEAPSAAQERPGGPQRSGFVCEGEKKPSPAAEFSLPRGPLQGESPDLKDGDVPKSVAVVGASARLTESEATSHGCGDDKGIQAAPYKPPLDRPAEHKEEMRGGYGSARTLKSNDTPKSVYAILADLDL